MYINYCTNGGSKWELYYLPNDSSQRFSIYLSPSKIKFLIICHQISLVCRQVLSLRFTNLAMPNSYIEDDILFILLLKIHYCTRPLLPLFSGFSHLDSNCIDHIVLFFLYTPIPANNSQQQKTFVLKQILYFVCLLFVDCIVYVYVWNIEYYIIRLHHSNKSSICHYL